MSLGCSCAILLILYPDAFSQDFHFRLLAAVSCTSNCLCCHLPGPCLVARSVHLAPPEHQFAGEGTTKDVGRDVSLGCLRRNDCASRLWSYRAGRFGGGASHERVARRGARWTNHWRGRQRRQSRSTLKRQLHNIITYLRQRTIDAASKSINSKVHLASSRLKDSGTRRTSRRRSSSTAVDWIRRLHAIKIPGNPSP